MWILFISKSIMSPIIPWVEEMHACWPWLVSVYMYIFSLQELVLVYFILLKQLRESIDIMAPHERYNFVFKPRRDNLYVTYQQLQRMRNIYLHNFASSVASRFVNPEALTNGFVVRLSLFQSGKKHHSYEKGFIIYTRTISTYMIIRFHSWQHKFMSRRHYESGLFWNACISQHKSMHTSLLNAQTSLAQSWLGNVSCKKVLTHIGSLENQ